MLDEEQVTHWSQVISKWPVSHLQRPFNNSYSYNPPIDAKTIFAAAAGHNGGWDEPAMPNTPSARDRASTGTISLKRVDTADADIGFPVIMISYVLPKLVSSCLHH